MLVSFAELMVLGFISLLLTFGQNYIIQICIPQKAANTMLPCRMVEEAEVEGHGGGGESEGKGKGGHGVGGDHGNDAGGETHLRRLLWDALTGIYSNRRRLMEPLASYCLKVRINVYGFFS